MGSDDLSCGLPTIEKRGKWSGVFIVYVAAETCTYSINLSFTPPNSFGLEDEIPFQRTAIGN